MEIGLYGKLPSHGDFLRRRTSDAFVAAWDTWLQTCLAASQSALGERWLDVYLTSPAWRFTGAAGICGPTPVLGLMAPSVDRVGRCFPLTLVAELPPHANLLAVATGAARFFERAERLVIDTLSAEYIDFEGFDERVVRLADELTFASLPPRLTFEAGADAILDANPHPRWHVPVGAVDDLGHALEALLSQRLSSLYAPLMFWWSGGSAIIDPSCLITRGLPSPEGFAPLLDGTWEQHQWRAVGATITGMASADALVHEPALTCRSAAASDVGLVRQINEDAYIERPEIGVWAVADGLGGHSDGEMASRMVCDALADFQPESSFEETIDAVRTRMQEVNQRLIVAASRSLLGDRSGSTVVILLVRGRRCAFLWAGDSRLYRWRAGRLEQLTRDHSPNPDGPAGRRESNAVTRAVGAQGTLELDVRRDLILDGDRFLLCSDGLTRIVPESDIALRMETADIRPLVNGLIEATLTAGAPDNVTALVVEAADAP